MTLSPAIDALLGPFVDPASRTWGPALLLAGGVAALVSWRLRGALRAADVLPWAIWRHPSSVLDVQLFLTRRLAGVILPIGGGAGALALATAIVRGLDGIVGRPDVPQPPAWALAAGVALVTFVASDASRYLLHRALHQVPALWAFHQVHHGAEVLTPLTLYRVHPVEGLLFGLRGTLVLGAVGGLVYWLFRDDGAAGTVLGVTAIGFVLNGLVGNLRHSHVAWGFGAVERWLLSPAQHQLHHARDRAGQEANFGVWLACWDRWGGTWRPSIGAVTDLGLDPADRNHAPDDLLSVLVGPVRASARALGRAPVAALALAVAAEASAEDTVVADEDDGGTIVVIGEAGELQVPGAAAVIGEAELDRYAYDDIHRVLARVPGIYARGEDGYGLRPNLGIRGASSDRSAKVALMEDGVLFGPAPYAAPAAYYFPLPLRLVGVEVYKGAAATRFGPNTVGGAINLRTRAVPEDGLAGALDLAGGSYGTTRGHGWIGAGTARAGVVIEIAHLGTGGFKELDTGGPTGFQRQDAMLKARLASGGPTAHAVELKLGYGRERSDETYLGLTPDDFAATPYRRYAASARDQMRWDRTEAELAWTVDGPALDVRTVAYHHHLARAWAKFDGFADGPAFHDLLAVDAGGQAGVYQAILRGDVDSGSDAQLLKITTNDRRFHAFGVQSVGAWSVAGDTVASKLEVGVRLHGDVVDRLHTSVLHAMTGGHLVATDAAPIVALDSLTTAFAAAGHVQEDLLIGDLRLLPGARVEAIRGTAQDAGAEAQTTTRVVALPGFGVIGEARPWLDLFAGAHRGFTPAAPGQPAEVRPELSWNLEAGARADTADTHAELTGFFVDYQNLAGACTLSAGCAAADLDRQFNGGRVRVGGAEAAVSARRPLPADLTLGAELSWTWTWSAFATSFDSGFPQYGAVKIGDRLPYVPEHQGAGRIELLHERFTLGVAANYRGVMRDVASQGPIPDRDRVTAAFVCDVSAEVPVHDRVSAYGTVQNVANTVTLEGLQPVGARPGAPRMVMLGVRVR